MSTIATLSKLELSRYGPYLLGTKTSNYRRIVLAMAVMLVASVAILREPATVSSLFASGILFLFQGMVLLVLYEAITSDVLRDKEWWLLLPHSRLLLLLGKALGLLRVSGHLAGYMLIVRLAHYALAVSWKQVEPAGLAELLRILAVDALLAAAGMPVVIGLGLLLTAFPGRLARMLVVMLSMYISMPMLVFIFLAGQESFAADFLAAGAIARGALTIAAAGWPFAGLCLWLATRFGMKRLGGIRYSGEAAGSRLLRRAGASRRAPFHAFVAMERGRYLSFVRTKAGKLVACLLPAAAAFFAYRCEGDMKELIVYQSYIFLAGYMGIAVYYLNRHLEFQRQYAIWWLTFPHSRHLLMASRAYAYLSVMLPYWGLLLFCAAAGALLRQWIDPMPEEQWRIVWQFAGHYALLFVPLTILYIAALQGTAAFVNRPWMAVFATPLYAGYMLGFPLSNLIIAPNWKAGMTYFDGPAPDFWMHLTLFYALVIPFAAWCFWLGGKHMHRYLLVNDTPWKGWKSGK